MEFRCADLAQESLDEVLAGHPVRKLLIDPPRSGAIEILKGIGPTIERLVYVSCNPETLARDLKYLTRHGYQAVKIQPVDNFPFCDHIETGVKLVRKKKKICRSGKEDFDNRHFLQIVGLKIQ